eukprot:snap_masked-scaffold_63-processed-gene-0.39-mRNA-1 protein AED:1.00 eAED:1.00 QI:0/-1/0/0/-1/1/1/0/538
MKFLTLLTMLFSKSVSKVDLVNIEIGEIFTGFKTTRYSDQMGSFDVDCTFSSIGTTLLPSENPCKKSSFSRDLNNQTIIVSALQSFGCFEETSYSNLESLGAVAVIVTEPEPPGTAVFRSHWTHKRNKGSIPFLDTGLDFFTTFKKFSSVNFEVQVNGCNDENVFKRCNEVQGVIFSMLTCFLCIYVAIISAQSLINTRIKKNSLPRQYILKVVVGVSVWNAFMAFFNMQIPDAFVWISDGKFKTNVSLLFLAINHCLFIHSILLIAYNWTFLNERCFPFQRRSKLVATLLSGGFFGSLGFKLINASFFISLVIAVPLILQPNFDFTFVSKIFFFVETFLGLYFAISNFQFISNGLNVLQPRSGSEKISVSSFSKLTGLGLEKAMHLSAKESTNSFSTGTFVLMLHLSYWLRVYFALLIISGIFDFVILEKLSAVGRFDDDFVVQSCLFDSLEPGTGFIRFLMLMALVKGIKGPEHIKKTITGSKREIDGRKSPDQSDRRLNNHYVVRDTSFGDIPNSEYTAALLAPTRSARSSLRRL